MLAQLLLAQSRLESALLEYQWTLELLPNSAQTHFRFGQTLQTQRSFKPAINEYQKTLELDPRHLPACPGLAWLLATCPDNTLRNVEKAVDLAQQAVQVSRDKSPEILDTLAAAYAEAGRFPEAVETARQAMELSTAQSNKPLTEAIQTQLRLFEANSPYHEKP